MYCTAEQIVVKKAQEYIMLELTGIVNAFI